MPALSKAPRFAVSVAVVAVLALLWWFQGAGDGDAEEARQAPATSSVSSSEPTMEPTSGEPTSGEPTSGEPTSGEPTSGEPADPESGLRWVDLADLPPEAAHTLDLIEAGGPFPYDRDGITFENRERLLPLHERGYYREYTVDLTPDDPDGRGPLRIVTGDPGEEYWTEDHYASFDRIRR